MAEVFCLETITLFHQAVLASVQDWWGLSLPQTLLIVAVILMFTDFFIQSDILTHIAYVLFAVVVAYYVPVHIMFRVLIGLVAWIILIYIHYSLWREFAAHFVNRVIAPTKFQAGARGLIGRQGLVKEIDGHSMVSVEGDLWSYESPSALPAGTKVRVIDQRSGVLYLEVVEEE